MATQTLNADNLKSTITAEGIVLIDWWAAWCGPCRLFAPTYERVSEQHPDIVFGKIDTQAEPELGAAFGIRSIPTLMLFRDGILLFNQAGMLPQKALEELIDKARQLDMDEVRRELKQSQAATEDPAAQAAS